MGQMAIEQAREEALLDLDSFGDWLYSEVAGKRLKGFQPSNAVFGDVAHVLGGVLIGDGRVSALSVIEMRDRYLESRRDWIAQRAAEIEASEDPEAPARDARRAASKDRALEAA